MYKVRDLRRQRFVIVVSCAEESKVHAQQLSVSVTAKKKKKMGGRRQSSPGDSDVLAYQSKSNRSDVASRPTILSSRIRHWYAMQTDRLRRSDAIRLNPPPHSSGFFLSSPPLVFNSSFRHEPVTSMYLHCFLLNSPYLI